MTNGLKGKEEMAGNRAVSVLRLNEAISQTKFVLEEIDCSKLDKDQRSTIDYVYELLEEASNAAGYLADTLDAW